MSGGEIALFKCDIEGSEHDLFARAEARDLESIARFAIEYHDNLRPGTLDLIRRRLAPTHEVVTCPAGDRGYGMLYGRAR